MKETVTEFEVEEREEEKVYCDLCQSDCTEKYVEEPRQVCPDCHDETGRLHWGKNADKVMRGFETPDEKELGSNGEIFVMYFLFYPIAMAVSLPVLMLGAFEKAEDGIAAFLAGVAGTLIYTYLITTFIL